MAAIFGIRHHGPGSARSLVGALAELEPDALLVEGPPDADALLPLLAHPELRPPVALLVYAVDAPRRAVFYPLAIFSPELQAIRYALARGIPVRFMDLPQWHGLALQEPDDQSEPVGAAEPQEPGEPREPVGAAEPAAAILEPAQGALPPVAWLLPPEQDPLGALAAAAGYSDGERWWEQMVEQRHDGRDLFAAVLEAMSALREGAPPSDPLEELREAWMRRTIRAAEREGLRRVAVVCGAWHAPALAEPGDKKADEQRLKGLPKIKTAAAIAPWTYGRLAYSSGYGAGVTSPGWYEHLWASGQAGHAPAEVTTRWMTHVARLLRGEDLAASAAHVIEAVRLAESLAALRERPLPGLPELDDACRAVFCFGSDGPMQLIQARLIVGERLGAVPDEAPAIPLEQDLRAEQRRLRLSPEAGPRQLDLDLRKPNDRERSALLRRLALLDLAWGQLGASGGLGTFRETWQLEWAPELSVALIVAGVWGTTVRAAAAARALDQANGAADLPALVGIVNQTLLAALPELVGPLMAQLQARAAQSGDAGELMDALTREDRLTRSSLVASLRYGSVRETDLAAVGQVVDGLVTRICVGLPNACTALGDDPATAMFARIVAVDSAIGALQRPGQREDSHAALRRVADLPTGHGLLVGRACRILLDAGALAPDDVGRRLGLALSVAADPTVAAAWVEGLLRDSGDLLVHDQTLWALIDDWLASLRPEAFQAALPLLRRTFATFAAPARRQLGEQAARGKASTARGTYPDSDFDHARGAAALALVGRIFGHIEEPNEHAA